MADDEEAPDLVEVEDAPEAGPSTSRDIYDRPKVPITLLTGYLGAGKSTLLDYVLTADHGYRIAVCMNDFGDTTDIEAKALTLSDPTTGEQSSSFLSLPNGCLCCSVKDLGIAAIEDMVASQRDKVDWVMVELTGVADPGPIAKSFWSNEEMGDLVLDGIVCVVDSKNILKQLKETGDPGSINEAQRQLAASDMILLNKTDLVSTEELNRTEQMVRSINPTLRLHRTVKGRMPLDELFNLRSYSSGNHAIPVHNEPNTSSNQHDHTDHEHDHSIQDGHDHGSSHLNDISTVTIPLPILTGKQYKDLNMFLETLLWDSKVLGIESEAKVIDKLEVLRCKGLMYTEDGKEYILQGVMDIFELRDISKGTSSSGQTQEAGGREERGKVVFIGRSVQVLKEALERYLES